MKNSTKGIIAGLVVAVTSGVILASKYGRKIAEVKEKENVGILKNTEKEK